MLKSALNIKKNSRPIYSYKMLDKRTLKQIDAYKNPDNKRNLKQIDVHKEPDKRNLELYQQILEIPTDYRCIQSSSGSWRLPLNQVLLGVTESNFFGWSEFSRIERTPSGFQFYLGASHLDVFTAYVNSSFPLIASELFVGSSTLSYSLPNSTLDESLDYTAITEILSKGFYPNLNEFRFGITELFCNAHGFNGAIGDITTLLEKMPNLELLVLGGTFSLTKPLNLTHLKELDIQVVDMSEVSLSMEPTVDTFKNLFKSHLTELNELTIDFNCFGSFERRTNYSFPAEFLNAEYTPALNSIEITGLFEEGEVKRLKNSLLWNKCQRKFCNITEAYYLAIDVYYEGDIAFVAGVAFSDYSQTDPDRVYYSELKVPGDYEPDEYYKRELPCIIKLIDEHDLSPHVIIIDGYTHLDGVNKWELGDPLSNHFFQNDQEIAVIGVAKTPSRDTPKDREVFRGNNSKALYVQATGLDNDFSRKIISGMSGDHRLPALLRLVDKLCRDRANSVG